MLCLFFLFGLFIYAGTHSASQILPGTFIGNFIFNGSLNVKNNLSVGKGLSVLGKISAKNITQNGEEIATKGYVNAKVGSSSIVKSKKVYICPSISPQGGVCSGYVSTCKGQIVISSGSVSCYYEKKKTYKCSPKKKVYVSCSYQGSLVQ